MLRIFSSAFRVCRRLALLTICIQSVFAPTGFAADGHMGIVTGNPGKIMDGNKVLADVPKGTRLWIFSEMPGWTEVKIPNQDERGWISEKHIEKVILTAQQNAQLKEADAHYAQYQQFHKERKFADALRSLESCYQIDQFVHGPDHPQLANTLHELGNLASAQANYPTARKHFEEALAIFRKVLGSNDQETAATLHHFGVNSFRQGDYPTAQKCLAEALAIYRKVRGNEHADTASTLHNLGFVAQKQKDYPAARSFYDEALAIRRKVLGSEHADNANTLNELGVLAYDQGDYPIAQKHFDEALIMRRKVLGNEHPSTAATLNNLGIVAHDQKDYPAARKFYDEALAIRRQVLGAEHAETAATLQKLGSLAIDQWDFATARKFCEEALTIRRKVLGNEHAGTASTLNNLGILADGRADYPTARKFYEEALAIEIKIHGRGHIETTNTLHNLAVLIHLQGDYPTALKYHDEVLAIRRKVLGNEHPNTAASLTCLGDLNRDQGDLLTARKCYEEALAIDRKALGNEHPNTAGTLSKIGNLARVQGDFPTAKRYLEESLAIQQKLGKDYTPHTLNSLGLLACAQHDYSVAWKYFEESLKIKRKLLGNENPNTAETLTNLGDLFSAKGNYPSARNHYDESRRILRTHVQRTLPGLSEVEQLHFLEKKFFAGWTRNLSFGWLQSTDLNNIETAAGWLVNGKAVAQESLAAQALLARDATNPQLAALVTDLKAARQELASLSLSTVLVNQVATQQQKLAQLTADEQRLARSLAQATGQAPPTSTWVEMSTLRQSIPADALYVDLVRMSIDDAVKQKQSQPHYLAWIIPGGKDSRLTVLDLGEAASLERNIEQARVALAKVADENSRFRQEGEAAAAAQAAKDLQAVANVVLKPLLPQLANKKQLILSPDGALWLLPWAALPVAEKEVLLERCSLRFVLSGRDLVKKETGGKLTQGAPAIVVNPDYDLIGTAAKAAIQAILPQTTFDETENRSMTSRSSLPRVRPLPFTSLEGAAAAPLFKHMTQSEPRTYEQDQALEAVVKNLKRPKLLVLSTHGFFLPDQERKETDDKLLASNSTRSLPALTKDGQPVENPLLRCGLLFAGCNSPRLPGLDDGILTGMEIVGMDLRGTELVVLSACETGIGKVRNGEGVAGLRQAFQLAGAQSVVSTLWQVPDHDSAIIMQDFFTNLAAGQSKAEALRNAQLKRIEARKEKNGAAHPFFWAAWTVTGQ